MNRLQAIKLAHFKRQKPVSALVHAVDKLVENQQSYLEQLVDKIGELPAPVVTLTPTITNEITATLDVEKLAAALPAPVVTVAAPQVEVKNTLAVETDIYDRYKRANSAEDNTGTYHGFVDKAGHWFIQLESDTDTSGQSRYAAGLSDFRAHWAKRQKLNYKLFSEVDIA